MKYIYDYVKDGERVKIHAWLPFGIITQVERYSIGESPRERDSANKC